MSPSTSTAPVGEAVASADLPIADLASDLRELATLAARDDLGDLFRRGVDWLQRLVPYDLATVFVLRGDRLVARLARGPLANDRVRAHVLKLEDFPSIREALETCRARAVTEDDHAHGEGDAFDGVLDLPHGHACMVVPLCAGEERLGVLTLDRAVCQRYEPAVVELAEVYGQLLALAIRGAEQRQALRRLVATERQQRRHLEELLSGDALGVLLESRSKPMQDVVRRAQQVAETDTPVLVLGETGTGKERLARAIHLWGARRDAPFVAVNVAAIPRDLIESELFGHTKGAFTGAGSERAGRLRAANGGTLLLDEIGELPLELQAKLLRFLQEGTFTPLGSDETLKVDVRVLAATHVDLERAVAERRFREDLYYRLAVFPVRVPPLRERREDLPLLCEVLLREQAARTGRGGVRVGSAALAKLCGYAFPGNLRELANLLERATILAPGVDLLPAEAIDLPGGRPGCSQVPSAATPGVAAADDADPIVTLEEAQRRHITRALERTRGKIYGRDGAAALLGLKPSTLQSKMKRLWPDR